LAVLVAVLALAPVARGSEGPGAREGASHAVPLYGELIRPYDAPESPFAAGHRGADVAAPQGHPVRASADGVVTFSGSVAGNLSVSVEHADGSLSTYSYLGSALVGAGDPVTRGQPLGTVGAGHPGLGLPPHVHLAARRDGVYLDPLALYVGSSHADLVALTR
jgi:murein DD-endopeptidase MepM/ murein hydrolase activator NlpD